MSFGDTEVLFEKGEGQEHMKSKWKRESCVKRFLHSLVFSSMLQPGRMRRTWALGMVYLGYNSHLITHEFCSASVNSGQSDIKYKVSLRSLHIIYENNLFFSCLSTDGLLSQRKLWRNSLLVFSMLTLNHGGDTLSWKKPLSLLSQRMMGVSRREPRNEAC